MKLCGHDNKTFGLSNLVSSHVNVPKVKCVICVRLYCSMLDKGECTYASIPSHVSSTCLKLDYKCIGHLLVNWRPSARLDTLTSSGASHTRKWPSTFARTAHSRWPYGTLRVSVLRPTVPSTLIQKTADWWSTITHNCAKDIMKSWSDRIIPIMWNVRKECDRCIFNVSRLTSISPI
jgi:hypothetical protein